MDFGNRMNFKELMADVPRRIAFKDQVSQLFPPHWHVKPTFQMHVTSLRCVCRCTHAIS